MTRSCSINGCSRPHEARGWCTRHYRRFLVHGDPEKSLRPEFGASLRERADRLTDKSGDCWLWTGYLDKGGYGRAFVDGSAKVVHRLLWEAVNGPVPEGLELDHLCNVRNCVRIDHLEPVTHAENMRRATARRSSDTTLSPT